MSDSSSNSNTIFNVPEPQGIERVKFETTAAEAQANAPTSQVAREIENNADRTKGAVGQAATVAKTLGPQLTGEPTTAVDQFGRNASETTNAAVNEGKHDVEAAKAAGAGYIEQAKSMASSAISTAQNYLPAAVGGKPAENSSDPQSGSSILSSTAAYLSSASQTVKENSLGTAGTQGLPTKAPASSTGIPATSAPLESGPHTTTTPYPSTTTKTSINIAQNEGAPSVN
ncbi:hypothetical protein BDQ17DRAFT_1341382, partial [Cyathus striatus]